MDDETKEKMSPELVITYGGHIVSKRLKQFIRNNPHVEHWHVAADGEIVDLFGKLTTVIEMDPFEFLEKIAGLLDALTPQYPLMWENYFKELPTTEMAHSEMTAIGALLSRLPAECVLHFANSSTLRYAQLFNFPATIEASCNRVTSGIDGSWSTPIGYAPASDNITFILIGDLSFFSALNALWHNT